MKKAKNVVEFYTLTNILKTTIRKGWLNWHVKAERVESVAEHVYATQMLALAMYSEYEYDLDIAKVMYMLAIHELEETIIGDLTFKEISSDEKEKIVHEAITKILSNLISGDEIKKLIYEFDAKETKEARFAYHCDKLECDLQCKLYDEKNYVDPADQLESDNHNPIAFKKILNGEITWSYSWMNHDRPFFTDDSNFIEVLDYAIENKITKDEKYDN